MFPIYQVKVNNKHLYFKVYRLAVYPSALMFPSTVTRDQGCSEELQKHRYSFEILVIFWSLMVR